MDTNVQQITNLYRAVVADGGLEKTAINQAIHDVAAQVQPLIDSGQIVPDTYSWVKAIVMQVDKAEKNSTDETLAAIARGEDDLSLDAPAHLDRVIPAPTWAYGLEPAVFLYVESLGREVPEPRSTSGQMRRDDGWPRNCCVRPTWCRA